METEAHICLACDQPIEDYQELLTIDINPDNPLEAQTLTIHEKCVPKDWEEHKYKDLFVCYSCDRKIRKYEWKIKTYRDMRSKSQCNYFHTHCFNTRDFINTTQYTGRAGIIEITPPKLTSEP